MLFLSLLILLHGFACSGYCNRSLMNQIRHELARLRAVLLALAIRLHLREPPRCYRQLAAIVTCGETRVIYRIRAKPEWVKHEVLRLKALMPHTGCRKIAECFNRRFEEARQMTAGKTYVSNTLRKYHYKLAILKRQIKNAKPKAVPKNLIWALDLSGKTT